jgi:hypothetical protein
VTSGRARNWVEQISSKNIGRKSKFIQQKRGPNIFFFFDFINQNYKLTIKNKKTTYKIVLHFDKDSIIPLS